MWKNYLMISPTSLPKILSSADDSNYNYPVMTTIFNRKNLHLTPSPFHNACICGHNYEYRNILRDKRQYRNNKIHRTTILPKTSPVIISLK